MSFVIGFVLLGISETLYLAGYYAVRSARPPFWTSDDWLMSFVGPVIMAFAVSGFVLIGAPFLTGTWRQFDLGNLAEIGIVVAVCAMIWPLMSRRHHRSLAQAPVAHVIPLTAAEAPNASSRQEIAAPLKAA